ncbi:hypothetical protein [Catellatospora tritici]|uniref:hypothetical protein n=1 Tax=Catellatospora tritici TaxID=2851566 RepID=UPI001C2DD8AD|nr:hypothetical protein [Catellatospora tritici]
MAPSLDGSIDLPQLGVYARLIRQTMIGASPHHRLAPAVIIAGHAFMQNLRRGQYKLATDTTPTRRVAAAFAELAKAT